MRQRGFAVPLTLILYGAAALAILGALWGLYNAVEGRGYDRAKAECERAAAAQRAKEAQAGAAASTKLEDSNAKAKTVYRTITRSVDRYIDRPIYRAECFDADGLRDAQRALAGPRADPGKPDGAVPGSDAARGRDRGGGATEDRRDR